MPVLKLSADEITTLRKTLKMSEAELAERIELEDRQAVKHAVVRLLGERGLLSERHVCDPPAAAPSSAAADRMVDAVAEHLRLGPSS